MVRTVSIRDMGPITSLTIDIPEQGGVVVLSGRNGAGKSTALEAVDGLLRGRTDITPRDGCDRGELDAFGAVLRVGRRTSRSGSLEVTSLEGRLSPAQLVDPGLKSPDAADAVRIKALLQLVGAKPELSQFWSLVGGQEQFEAAVPGDLSDESDLVALAGKIKRGLESAARRVEGTAENEAAKAAAYRKGIEGVVLTAPDKPALQAELEAAIRDESRLLEQSRTGTRLRADAANARKALESSAATPMADLTSRIAAASADLESLEARKSQASRAAAEASAAYEAARQAMNQALAAEESAIDALARQTEVVRALNDQQSSQAAAAQQHAAAVAGWKAAIERAEAYECPTADELAAASAVVQSCHARLAAAAVSQRAIEQAATADQHEAAAKEAYRLSEQYRAAAAATDDVLSAAVAKTGTDLVVRSGRLWIETRRGLTQFSDLSHGERWKTAIDVALAALPEDGDMQPLLTIPQEAWEGLDPVNRSLVSDHAITSGVVILTAECSDSETLIATTAN